MQLVTRHRTRLATLALAGTALIATATSPAMAAETGGTPSSDRVVSPNGAGEWDYVGGDIFATQSRNFQSGGGDFMICIEYGGANSYELWEEDPANPDDKVGHVLWPGGFDSNGCHAFRGISKYVDGVDGQAEFYVKSFYGWPDSTVYAYD